MGLVRAEPGSLNEVGRVLDFLGAGGGGGLRGKELNGADGDEETEEKEGTLCALQTPGHAERGIWEQ